MEKEKALKDALDYTRKAIETEQDEFIMICPKCGGSIVTLGMTYENQLIFRCANKNDCRHSRIF